MSTHALVDKAMVMSLSIGIWEGQRLDKDASRKVTEQAGASADAARVNKHLIPKEKLEPVKTARNNIRTHFYTNTLPWRDNGDRLMTRKLFTSFIAAHEKLADEFRDAVAVFLNGDYPSVIEQASFRLGDMFKREDFPPISDLRRRFYIELDYSPVSTAGDFRVEMDQEHVDKIKAQMEAAAEQRVNGAMQDVWRRLAETVGYFAERMDDSKAIFRDSTVEKIAELIDLVPGLNVLEDPNIEMIRQQVAAKLGGIEAKDIRKDPALRAELAGEAKAIVDQMSGFMSAFGNGAA